MSRLKKPQSMESLLNLPTLLTLIIMLLLGFGQLQRIQLTNQVAIYGHDFFIGIFVFWCLLLTPRKIQFFQEKMNKWKVLAYFIAWTIISLGLNQIISGMTLIPWLYNLRFWLYLGFGLMLDQQLMAKKISLSVLRAGTLMMFGIIIFIGIFQYLYIPDLRFLGESGWDVHYYRMAGNMLDPNFYGIVITLAFIFLLTLGKTCQERLWTGLIYATWLALTYSRSSYLAFAFVLTYLLIQSHKLRLSSLFRSLVFTLVTFCLILAVLPHQGGLGVQLTRTETITSRIESNQSVLSTFDWHTLLIGKGFFNPSINQNRSAIVHAHFPDNLLVFLLNSTGLPGLYLIGKLAYLELKKALKEQAIAIVATMGGVLLHAQFNHTLFEPVVLLITLITLLQLPSQQQPILNQKADKIGN